ncbi:MAG: hypothetical protein FJ297_04140 [Planctomycetes bacterium]|nr:hypothetical protein [Planctomycetota bacterium]
MMRRSIWPMLACALAALWNAGCQPKSDDTKPKDKAAADSRASAESATSDHAGSHAHGAKSSHPAADVPTGTPSVAPEVAVSPETAPETVVTAFLDATRRGDDALAARLLSKKAVAETTRVGLAVKPPGTPTMKYAIARTEYPPEVPDGVYVHSVWSETSDSGEEQFDVTWVLRKQPEGWRIVGMAAQMVEDEPPFFLNFEQPEDLYRKMREADAQTADAQTADAQTGDAQTGDAPPANRTEDADSAAGQTAIADQRASDQRASTAPSRDAAPRSGPNATAREPSTGNPLR